MGRHAALEGTRTTDRHPPVASRPGAAAESPQAAVNLTGFCHNGEMQQMEAMMAKYRSRTTAVWVVGILTSGCAGQSMPVVEDMTRPTTEAFARLSSWRPWSSQEKAAPLAPVPVQSEPLPPVVSEAPKPPLPPPPAKRIAASAAVKPKSASPHIEPASLQTPEIAAPKPFAVKCESTTQPGGRVSMQCSPID